MQQTESSLAMVRDGGESPKWNQTLCFQSTSWGVRHGVAANIISSVPLVRVFQFHIRGKGSIYTETKISLCYVGTVCHSPWIASVGSLPASPAIFSTTLLEEFQRENSLSYDSILSLSKPWQQDSSSR
nr:hypothetical protein CFP56_77408 [Quercus suber]